MSRSDIIKIILALLILVAAVSYYLGRFIFNNTSALDVKKIPGNALLYLYVNRSDNEGFSLEQPVLLFQAYNKLANQADSLAEDLLLHPLSSISLLYQLGGNQSGFIETVHYAESKSEIQDKLGKWQQQGKLQIRQNGSTQIYGDESNELWYYQSGNNLVITDEEVLIDVYINALSDKEVLSKQTAVTGYFQSKMKDSRALFAFNSNALVDLIPMAQNEYGKNFLQNIGQQNYWLVGELTQSNNEISIVGNSMGLQSSNLSFHLPVVNKDKTGFVLVNIASGLPENFAYPEYFNDWYKSYALFATEATDDSLENNICFVFPIEDSARVYANLSELADSAGVLPPDAFSTLCSNAFQFNRLKFTVSNKLAFVSSNSFWMDELMNRETKPAASGSECNLQISLLKTWLINAFSGIFNDDENSFVNHFTRVNLQWEQEQFILRLSSATPTFSNGNVAASPLVNWAFHADSANISSVFVVKNHSNGQNEIFMQDAENRLYLIDNKAKILWTKRLESPILGNVQQIDYYDNQKLQYLFNTESHIHLIDRLSMNVADFPLKLASPASRALTFVTYDNKMDRRRIFVPAVNGGIYGYELSGKPLSGWTPCNNAGKVMQAMDYEIIQAKDYLNFFTEEGKIISLDRQGNIRQEQNVGKVPTKAWIPFSNELFTNYLNVIDGKLLAVAANAKVKTLSDQTLLFSTTRKSLFVLNEKEIIQFDNSLNQVDKQSVDLKNFKCKDFQVFSNATHVVYLLQDESEQWFSLDEKGIPQQLSNAKGNLLLSDFYNNGKAYAFVYHGKELVLVSL